MKIKADWMRNEAARTMRRDPPRCRVEAKKRHPARKARMARRALSQR
jgi:hypothetical protein